MLLQLEGTQNALIEPQKALNIFHWRYCDIEHHLQTHDG